MSPLNQIFEAGFNAVLETSRLSRLCGLQGVGKESVPVGAACGYLGHAGFAGRFLGLDLGVQPFKIAGWRALTAIAYALGAAALVTAAAISVHSDCAVLGHNLSSSNCGAGYTLSPCARQERENGRAIFKF